MAYAFVRQAENSSGSTAQPSIATPSFGGSVAAGNAFAWIVFYAHGSTRTVTMSGNSNTYTEVGSLFSAANNAGAIWGYAKNVNSGTTGVTGTFDINVDFPAILVQEFSGLATGTLFGSGETASSVQAAPGTGTNALTSGNITPGAQPAALVGWSFNFLSNTPPNAGTGFTSQTAVWSFGAAGNDLRPEDMRLTATTAVPATFTATGGADNYMTVGMVLREAAGGGGGPSHQTLTLLGVG